MYTVNGREIADLAEGWYHLRTDMVSLKVRKVLAAVVMKRRRDTKVVAIGTGTTCISGASLDEHGYVVNDCHAEVVARRAFVAYLYSKLKQFTEDQTESIFANDPLSNRPQLKAGVSFHLYISSVPCGDAAVFGLHEDSPNLKGELLLKRGRARAKIDRGEGGVYAPHTPQVWDQLKSGADRLYTMSCSDKLARWNLLGMQGSLLSIYMDPIYISTVTIGNDFSRHHLGRAIRGRITAITDLPKGYWVKRLELLDGNTPPHIKHSSDTSLSWSEGWSEMEKTDCRKQEPTGIVASKLCKHSFFERFLNLWNDLAPQEAKEKAARMIFPRKISTPIRVANSENLKAYLTYGEVKSLATDYGVAKAKLFEHYVNHCGAPWAKKPPEQDNFLF